MKLIPTILCVKTINFPFTKNHSCYKTIGLVKSNTNNRLTIRTLWTSSQNSLHHTQSFFKILSDIKDWNIKGREPYPGALEGRKALALCEAKTLPFMLPNYIESKLVEREGKEEPRERETIHPMYSRR